MSEHILPFRTYVIVWIALMALMVLTVYLSTVPMGTRLNTMVALFIAADQGRAGAALLHAPEVRELQAECRGVRRRFVLAADPVRT